MTPTRPRPKKGCIIPAAALVGVAVDAPVDDEVPEWVLPVDTVLVPVWFSVAAVAAVVC